MLMQYLNRLFIHRSYWSDGWVIAARLVDSRFATRGDNIQDGVAARRLVHRNLKLSVSIGLDLGQLRGRVRTRGP